MHLGISIGALSSASASASHRNGSQERLTTALFGEKMGTGRAQPSDLASTLFSSLKSFRSSVVEHTLQLLQEHGTGQKGPAPADESDRGAAILVTSYQSVSAPTTTAGSGKRANKKV